MNAEAPQTPPFDPVDHLLPPAHTKGNHQQSSVGPIAAIIIILTIMVAGAVYALSTYPNRQKHVDTLPLILGDTTEPVKQ